MGILPRLPDSTAHSQFRPEFDQQPGIKMIGDVLERPGSLEDGLVQFRGLSPVPQVERGVFFAGPPQPPGRCHETG